MHPKNKLDTFPLLDPKLRSQLLEEDRTTQGLRALKTDLGLTGAQIYDLVRILHRGPNLPMAKITDLTCPGPHGDFPARLYTPQAPTSHPRPLLVYCHGGGFILGSMASHDGILRSLAHHSGCPVLAFDYHLAPAYKHPTPIDECRALLEWVLPQADTLGFAPHRLALAGDSAGATIAMATLLHLRDQASPLLDRISALLLYYGYYGLAGSMASKIYGGWWDGLGEWDQGRFIRMYTEGSPQDPTLNILNNDLSFGLPKTYLLACDFDPLLDDTLTLAAVLGHHKVPHKVKVLKKAIHACLYYTHLIPAYDQALADSVAYWLQEDTP